MTFKMSENSLLFVAHRQNPAGKLAHFLRVAHIQELYWTSFILLLDKSLFA